jgi:glycosyltransferase involved in cell wall biosynthesis
MKICIVSQEFPAETGHGGIGVYAHNLSRALKRCGHDVAVISATYDNREKWEDVDGVRVLRLPLSAPKIITQRTVNDLITYSKKVRGAVMGLFGGKGPDIVEFPEFGAEGHAFLCNGGSPVPSVVRLHTPLYHVFKYDERAWTPRTLAMSELEKDVIRKAPFLSSPSCSLARIVAGDLGLSAENIRILPYPVDCEKFSPGGTEDEMTVLRVGRLQRFKGTHVLIQAVPEILRMFPRARFVFAGRDTLSGPNGASYKEWMLGGLDREYWSNLEFLDSVAFDEMPALYRRCAMSAAPSLYDNFPNVCLEAMACGKPLVASAVGGIPEMVKDGETGLLVPPSDPSALAGAICRLLGDERLRARLGASARKSMLADYEPSVIARRMVELYREAAAACACA